MKAVTKEEPPLLLLLTERWVSEVLKVALANVQRIILQWNNDDHPDTVQGNLGSTQDQSSFLLQLSSPCFKDHYSVTADLNAFPQLLYLITKPLLIRVCVCVWTVWKDVKLLLPLNSILQGAAGSSQFCCQRRQLWILREADWDVNLCTCVETLVFRFGFLFLKLFASPSRNKEHLLSWLRHLMP